MKIIITEEQKKKLFIPRKLTKDNSRYDEHNNSQPIKDGKRINQYTPDGLRTGYWEYYYSNGGLYSKGSYLNDNEDGYWEWYRDNGQLECKGNYVNGERDGYWEEYWSNGELWDRGSYLNGKRDGYWEMYYNNGELMSKGNYIDGDFIEVKSINESEKKKLFIPRKLSSGDSRYNEWNNSQPIRDGIRINQYTPDGLKIGHWEEYDDNGKIEYRCEYNNGKLNGEYVEYFPNGNIESKGNYVNGEMDGYWKRYWFNGKLRSEGNYVDDKKEGYWVWYYSDGNIESKGNFVDGNPDVYWEEYHYSGELSSKGSYLNTEKEGYWEYYHSNGKLRSKGNYIDGKRDGYWDEYNLNGEFIVEKKYVNGKFVDYKTIKESKKKLFIPRNLDNRDKELNDYIDNIINSEGFQDDLNNLIREWWPESVDFDEWLDDNGWDKNYLDPQQYDDLGFEIAQYINLSDLTDFAYDLIDFDRNINLSDMVINKLKEMEYLS
jgi:antitoxin component YwqK of YwqJK toxin-antitoxin module